MRSHSIQQVPLTVRRIPVHTKIEGLSPKKIVAETATNTGPRAAINDHSRGPRLIRDIKYKVSPRAIPKSPLIPKNKKACMLTGSMPIIKIAMAKYAMPIIPLVRFMLSGEISSPIFRQRIEPKAQQEAEAKAAIAPII